ncbi:Cob(I)yrinic acid a c-diamide adenosyltransferase [Fasciola hepatica]|uniref:Cob(I)yrinic acid a c-diamide adenosyltransferase n=1 Tax=Fasciola hepatica TaxID=6192 RepID=A0A4E0RCB9_FASHE|nr:Cob(I)yrinic acid a c-diamide adenosyltransferase [Fasciola hepatica]
MKIYTGTGDKGTSALFTGERRPKTDVVFDALGTVDELTSVIAMALAQIDLYSNKSVHFGYNLKELCDQLDSIQRRLQALSSSVATPIPSSSGPDAPEQRRARFKHVNFPEDASKELEAWIDAMTEVLPPLRQFILPSGGTPGTTLHFARSICRRAESSIRHYPGDELGRGAGKGGGTGGTIRDAGGAFGKRQASHEEEYFHRKEREQLHILRQRLEEEMQYRRDEIKKHEEAIRRHEKLINELEERK